MIFSTANRPRENRKPVEMTKKRGPPSDRNNVEKQQRYRLTYAVLRICAPSGTTS
jgi:hypothetical protein